MIPQLQCWPVAAATSQEKGPAFSHLAGPRSSSPAGLRRQDLPKGPGGRAAPKAALATRERLLDRWTKAACAICAEGSLDPSGKDEASKEPRCSWAGKLESDLLTCGGALWPQE